MGRGLPQGPERVSQSRGLPAASTHACRQKSVEKDLTLFLSGEGPGFILKTHLFASHPAVTCGEGFAFIFHIWVFGTGLCCGSCHRKPSDDPRMGPYANRARPEGQVCTQTPASVPCRAPSLQHGPWALGAGPARARN